MPENDKNRIITGSRDDLLINPSRCLRMRFSGSSCSHCADICPHGAVSFDSALGIDQDKCKGCLLCCTACPSGALEQSNDFSACLAKLSRLPAPVLGCIGTQERSNASITCLGGLSDEHLLALYAMNVQQIQLDLTTCSGCSNQNGIKVLRERLFRLERKTALPLGRKIRLVEQTAELKLHTETVGRRGFFKALTGVLLKETSALLVSVKTAPETSVPYTKKQLPQRSKILNQALEEMSAEEQMRIKPLFRFEIERSEGCDGCVACIKVCPTGAMTEGSNSESSTLEHDPLRCTGCGLCVEFCLNEALRLRNLQTT